MQLTNKEIYLKVADSNNIPVEKVKLVGDFIFEEISKRIKDPQSLILKIKSIGYFYLSKKKTIRFLEKIKREDPNNLKLILTLEQRLKDYEKYILKKTETKKIRNENSKLIEPPLQEEDV